MGGALRKDPRTGELELGKVNEPWDIGLIPAPENPPLQILLIEKADAASEAGARSANKKAELTRLRDRDDEGRRARPLAPPAPSAKAKRLTFTNNDLRVLDGPFSESKELVGGFAVLELSGHGRGHRPLPHLCRDSSAERSR